LIQSFYDLFDQFSDFDVNYTTKKQKNNRKTIDSINFFEIFLLFSKKIAQIDQNMIDLFIFCSII